MRTKFLAPIVIGALSLALAIPAGASSQRPPSIAAAVIAASGTGGLDTNPDDYDILLKAVIATGLDGALSDPEAKLTVFAPHDKAFMRTARLLGYTGSSEQGTWDFLVGAFTTLGNGDPIPVLKNVLLYHVAEGRMKSSTVLHKSSIKALLGERFGVDGTKLVDKDPDITNPRLRVDALDMKAGDGIIHGINRVLIPINIP